MTDEIERWLQGPTGLREVVVVKHVFTGSAGGTGVVPSVEIWDDVIRLHVVRTLAGHGPDEYQAWSVSDDVGTEYRFEGGASGKSGGSWNYGYIHFAPGPPSEATELRVENAAGGVSLVVPLRPQ